MLKNNKEIFFLILLFLLLFQLKTVCATVVVTTQTPSIIANFTDSVTVLDASLLDTSNSNQVALNLISQSDDNTSFTYQPYTSLVDKHTYNFSIEYMDLFGNYGERYTLFTINLSMRKPTRLSIETVDSLTLGQSGFFKVYAYFDGNTREDVTHSSNLNVDTSSSNKINIDLSRSTITATGVGSATITATYFGESDSKTVTVEPLPFIIKILPMADSDNKIHVNSNIVNISVITSSPASCKWRRNPSVSWEDFQSSDSTNTQFNFSDFEISGSMDYINGKTFYVKCQHDTGGDFIYKNYTFILDNAFPQITYISANPQIITESNPSGYYSSLILVNTSEDMVCKIDNDEISNFDNMQNYFFDYNNLTKENVSDASTYSKEHFFIFETKEDNADFDFNIICKNYLGVEAKSSVSVSVNPNLPFQVFIVSPANNGFAGENANLDVTTTKQATCDYYLDNETQQIPLPLNPNNPYEHYAETKTLSDGEHHIYVECCVGADCSDDSVNFIVDSSPPEITMLDDSVADSSNPDVTNTPKQLDFSFSAKDEQSGVSGYEYKVYKKGPDYDTLIANVNYATIDNENKSNGGVINYEAQFIPGNYYGVVLTNGSTYYFRVRVQNGAGLWSDYKESDGVTINTSLTSSEIHLSLFYKDDGYYYPLWSDGYSYLSNVFYYTLNPNTEYYLGVSDDNSDYITCENGISFNFTNISLFDLDYECVRPSPIIYPDDRFKPFSTTSMTGESNITAYYKGVQSNETLSVKILPPSSIIVLHPLADSQGNVFPTSGEFDLEILANITNLDTCKYSQNYAFNPNNHGSFFESNETDESGKVHFFKHLANIKTGSVFYIKCTDNSGGEYDKKLTFKLSGIPKITSYKVEPSVVSYYHNEELSTKLYLKTSLEAVCKLEDENTLEGYTVEPNNFFDYMNDYLSYSEGSHFSTENEDNDDTYSTAHYYTFNNLNDKTDYNYVVQCKSHSDDLSDPVRIHFSTDTNAIPTVTLIEPKVPIWLSNTSTYGTHVMIKVKTNRNVAACFYSNNTAADPYSITPTQFSNMIALGNGESNLWRKMNSEDEPDNTLFSEGVRVLHAGNFQFLTACEFYGVSNPVVKLFSFIVDSSKPVIYYVNDSTRYENPEQSADLNKLRFKVYANDKESGLKEIRYVVYEGKPPEASDEEDGEQIITLRKIPWTQDWITAHNLNLEYNKTYYFKVWVTSNAKDNYGRNILSAPVRSNGVFMNKSAVILESPCFNHVWNPDNNETDVDCGGNICAKRCNLGYGLHCEQDSDCLSGGYCNETNECDFLSNKKNETNHCNDGKLDNDETDIDCGGSLCGPCSIGEQCNNNLDCKSNNCDNGVCKKEVKTCDESIDSDCDGVPNEDDLCPGTERGAEVDVDGCSDNQKNETPSPKVEDSDNDGMPDTWEINHGLNPNDPSDANEDPDKDGLTNIEEYRLNTDPHVADSDGDGFSDGQEYNAGTDPNDPDSHPEGHSKMFLWILILIIILGVVGFFAYTQLSKNKTHKKPQKESTHTVSLRGYSTPKQTSYTGKTQGSQPTSEYTSGQYKQATPLTPDELALIRRRARIEEERRKLMDAFKTSKKTDQSKNIKTNKKKSVNRPPEAANSVSNKQPNEQEIIEIELPKEKKSINQSDVWERLDKLGNRIKGKDVGRELNRLSKKTKGEDVYKKLKDLAEQKSKSKNRRTKGSSRKKGK